MALTFEELTSVLRGEQLLPESRCLAYGLPLSHKQLLELVPLLQDDEQLRGLKLRGCRLCDEAAESVSRVVAFNSSLLHLDLRDNAIGGAGAMFLANALRNHNYTLLSLDLTGKSSSGASQLPAAAAEGGSTYTPPHAPCLSLAGNPAIVEDPEVVQEIALLLHRNAQNSSSSAAASPEASMSLVS